MLTHFGGGFCRGTETGPRLEPEAPAPGAELGTRGLAGRGAGAGARLKNNLQFLGNSLLRCLRELRCCRRWRSFSRTFSG